MKWQKGRDLERLCESEPYASELAEVSSILDSCNNHIVWLTMLMIDLKIICLNEGTSTSIRVSSGSKNKIWGTWRRE